MPEISTRTTNFDAKSVAEISETLRHLLADVFALFVKTKSFHWHIGGRDFRGDHQLLDDQATESFSTLDLLAERSRKIGGAAIRSIGDIARNQRLQDNDAPDLSATDMMRELLEDNRQLTAFLRCAHEVCDRHYDIATASLIENWIDQSEARVWFLNETTRHR